MNLKKWIEMDDAQEELLPLCHTTKWKDFEKILEEDNLSKDFSKFPDPNPQNIATEKIIYLFYGLPFYIYETGNGDEINSEVTEDLPIGLIFKPELSDTVERFYPFDTGALLSGNYKNTFDITGEEIEIYEVPISDGKEMQKFVKHYYNSNECYCFGRLNNSVSPASPKEENLLRLFAFSSKSKTDLRSRSIEIHSLKDIKLSTNLFAIILPRARSNQYEYFVDNIKAKCPSLKIEYYNDVTRYNSQSIRDAVLNKTMDMYDNEIGMQFSYNNL